jgi:ABC-type sulfate/molybdate transport systems ATPase subunit
MRRRVAIARALIHEPTVLLLDEPFASLDVDGKAWLEQLFQRWRDAGKIVCFANHDAVQSRSLADRILWIRRGRVEMIETVCPSPEVRCA